MRTRGSSRAVRRGTNGNCTMSSIGVGCIESTLLTKEMGEERRTALSLLAMDNWERRWAYWEGRLTRAKIMTSSSMLSEVAPPKAEEIFRFVP